MQLRKLYRTIEAIAAEKVDKEEEFFKHVLNEIVQNEEIEIKGARCWKLDAKAGSYELLFQLGDIDHIKPHYRIDRKSTRLNSSHRT